MLLAPTLIGDAIKYSEFKEYDNIARTQEQDVCTQAVNLAGTCMSPQHDRFLCICCYFFLLFNSLYAKIWFWWIWFFVVHVTCIHVHTYSLYYCIFFVLFEISCAKCVCTCTMYVALSMYRYARWARLQPRIFRCTYSYCIHRLSIRMYINITLSSHVECFRFASYQYSGVPVVQWSANRLTIDRQAIPRATDAHSCQVDWAKRRLSIW